MLEGDEMNNKIGVLDSGIGGMTVLDKTVKLLPREEYIYYADNKNNPYGEKTDKQLYKIVKENVIYLITKKNCKMIVLACNTATTKCMKKLKEEFPNILFVGTVPAIKVASDNNYKHTLVLATPATIDSERTKELIKENKKEKQEFTLIACDGLAKAIETNDEEKINIILKNIKDITKNKKIDSIVLGCTHYPLIKDKINYYFQNIPQLDGSLGVAKEVKRQLERNNLLNNQAAGKIEFIYTKDN